MQYLLELLTMLTVLMTPTVLKDIKVLTLGELGFSIRLYQNGIISGPKGANCASNGTSDSTCFNVAISQQC